MTYRQFLSKNCNELGQNLTKSDTLNMTESGKIRIHVGLVFYWDIYRYYSRRKNGRMMKGGGRGYEHRPSRLCGPTQTLTSQSSWKFYVVTNRKSPRMLLGVITSILDCAVRLHTDNGTETWETELIPI